MNNLIIFLLLTISFSLTYAEDGSLRRNKAVRAYKIKADQFRTARQWSEIVALMDEAIAKYPDKEGFYIARSDANVRLNDLDEAESDLIKVLKVNKLNMAVIPKMEHIRKVRELTRTELESAFRSEIVDKLIDFIMILTGFFLGGTFLSWRNKSGAHIRVKSIVNKYKNQNYEEVAELLEKETKDLNYVYTRELITALRKSNNDEELLQFINEYIDDEGARKKIERVFLRA